MTEDKYITERGVRFMRACVAALGYEANAQSIGTYSERALHKVLKFYIEPDESFHEIRYRGNIADVKNREGITEIQTRAFSHLKKKLSVFLEDSPVTVVYPLAAKKYIRRLDAKTGELSERRLSPIRCTVFDAAYELYNIREFFFRANFSVKLIFLETEEIKMQGERVKVGRRYREKVNVERIPRNILSEEELKTREDFRIFIPEGLPSQFTVSELERAIGSRFKHGFSVLSLLLCADLVEGPVADGRKKLYRLKSQSENYRSTENKKDEDFV